MMSPEEFIAQHEGDVRDILDFLHELLLSYPEISVKMRYKIPFYDRKSWVCYLNPVSGGGVELAFINGKLLSNEQNLLQTKGRKQVVGLHFQHKQDYSTARIKEILQEAFLVDEVLSEERKQRKG